MVYSWYLFEVKEREKENEWKGGAGVLDFILYLEEDKLRLSLEINFFILNFLIR